MATISRTLNSGSASPCGTTPIRRASSRRVHSATGSTVEQRWRRDVRSERPRRSCSSVDLPAPFGPSSAVIRPRAMSSVTSSIVGRAAPSCRKRTSRSDQTGVGAWRRDHVDTPAAGRRSSQTKQGTPTSAVTMPIGNSFAPASERASVSAATRNDAPASAEQGSSAAIVASPDESHRVRNDEPDEPDRAAHRHRRGGEQGRRARTPRASCVRPTCRDTRPSSRRWRAG